MEYENHPELYTSHFRTSVSVPEPSSRRHTSPLSASAYQHAVVLETGGALHNVPDQRDLLGPPNPPSPQATGRPEADEAAQELGGVHRGLAGAALQVGALFFLRSPCPL